MKFCLQTFTILFLIIVSSCAGSKDNPEIFLHGSTPGDSVMKSMLLIDPKILVDFIRWDLALIRSTSGENTFSLNIIYGESQPNTLGFKRDLKRSFTGSYTLYESRGIQIHGTVYLLKSREAPSITLALVKLNDNLYHFLNPEYKLLLGNGGWSYTLNNKRAIRNETEVLPALAGRVQLFGDTALQATFDGRTPCPEISDEYDLAVSSDCSKIKWRIILNRDPETLLPTTYVMQTVFARETPIKGKWSLLQGTKSNPDVLIIRLNPETPEKAISFLVGDENVLFFLDRENRLLTGNADFSYTLNRKM